MEELEQNLVLSNYQISKAGHGGVFNKKYYRTKLIEILECAENIWLRNEEKAVKEDAISGSYLKKLTKDLKFTGNLSEADHLKQLENGGDKALELQGDEYVKAMERDNRLKKLSSPGCLAGL